MTESAVSNSGESVNAASRPRLDPLEFAQWADQMRRDYGGQFHIHVDSNRQVITLTATVWRTNV